MKSTSPVRIPHYIIYAALLVCTALMINGCTVKRPVRLPSPETPETRPVPTPKPEVTPPSGVYTPTLGPAESLYRSAQQQLAEGNAQKAEMTMERALRVEPRNGHYWYTMARIKFAQHQYSQTIQLCLKSKSLSGQNRHLLALNEGLIEKAQNNLK